ncbi:hypothetical protein CLOM621_06253 [Clostridium sp. M62/1]|nr:hypothetical protein CLOM621_06253 [Clostridium sp. M62/1]
MSFIFPDSSAVWGSALPVSFMMPADSLLSRILTSVSRKSDLFDNQLYHWSFVLGIHYFS